MPGHKSNSLLDDEEVRLPELAVTNITSKFEKGNRSDVLQHSQINSQNREVSNFGSKRV